MSDYGWRGVTPLQPMFQENMIIAITGHRPDKLPDKKTGYKLPNPTYIGVCQALEKNFVELKPTKIISGMALGVDQWAAFIALKLKIPVLAAVPFEGQETKWIPSAQKTYFKLLDRVSEVIVVSPGQYTAEKMHVRNRWMVDQLSNDKGDKLIAVYDGSKGGTGNCYDYAVATKKDIILIDPKQFTIPT